MWENPIELFLTYWEFVTVVFTVWLFGFIMARRLEVVFKKDRRGRNLGERLERIEHQLYPNGGDSLADKVNQTQLEVKEMHGKLEVLSDLATRNWK
jgi:hypothetical protein